MADRGIVAGPVGLRSLGREPTAREREALRKHLGALLGWQAELARWPSPRAGLDATPFVSIYVRGRLLGCFGSIEGDASQRLARAFLRSVEDPRFGGVDATTRPALVAQISYPVHLRPLPRERGRSAPRPFALGTHGLVVELAPDRGSVVLPHVARDARLDADQMIDLALRKAGATAAEARSARLWIFETRDVTSRTREPAGDPLAAAEAWLAGLVGRDGRVAFGIDPRTGVRIEVGDVMHHGRVAVVIAALARRGHDPKTLDRTRRRLASEARSALAGKRVAGWPEDHAAIAGTLALACLAGARLRDALSAFARAHARAIARNPWHAAQVGAALGEDAGQVILRACFQDLARHPWAPWTVIAARKCGNAEVAARGEAALVRSIRKDAPHAGGADVTALPEVALTAIAVEALAPASSSAARTAVIRGRAFLRGWQFLGERIGASYEPEAVRGAFPISPAVDALRCDVTAHALLALSEPA